MQWSASTSCLHNVLSPLTSDKIRQEYYIIPASLADWMFDPASGAISCILRTPASPCQNFGTGKVVYNGNTKEPVLHTDGLPRTKNDVCRCACLACGDKVYRGSPAIAEHAILLCKHLRHCRAAAHMTDIDLHECAASLEEVKALLKDNPDDAEALQVCLLPEMLPRCRCKATDSKTLMCPVCSSGTSCNSCSTLPPQRTWQMGKAAHHLSPRSCNLPEKPQVCWHWTLLCNDQPTSVRPRRQGPALQQNPAVSGRS